MCDRIHFKCPIQLINIYYFQDDGVDEIKEAPKHEDEQQ